MGPARGRAASAGPAGAGARAALGAGGAGAPGVAGAVAAPRAPAAARTSSSETRPPGPVPRTWARSTPSSRASRRVAGVAAGGRPVAGAGGRRRGARRGAGGARGGGADAGVAGRAALPASPKLSSTAPDLDALAGLHVHGGHAPAERRGQLDLGLLGLHEEDGLILLDLVTLGDENADDLRLGEAFPEVGQLEVSRHRTRRRGATLAPARRRAFPGRRAARGPVPAASRARARSPGRRCRTR